MYSTKAEDAEAGTEKKASCGEGSGVDKAQNWIDLPWKFSFELSPTFPPAVHPLLPAKAAEEDGNVATGADSKKTNASCGCAGAKNKALSPPVPTFSPTEHPLGVSSGVDWRRSNASCTASDAGDKAQDRISRCSFSSWKGKGPLPLGSPSSSMAGLCFYPRDLKHDEDTCVRRRLT